MRELLFVRVQNAYQTKRMPKTGSALQRKMAAVVSQYCTCIGNAVRFLKSRVKN
jgi:hypothetical protein